MKALVLAAGRGERMRPLTDLTPKPLLRVGQRTLIEHHLAALVAADITDIVINVAWLGEQIVDYLGDGSRFGCAVRFSHEPDGALETGGGIANALPLLGSEPFWVVNGDIFARFDFAPTSLADGMLGHLVLVPNPPHNPGGDFGLQHGLVANEGVNKYTFSGISLLRPELLAGNSGGVFPLAPFLRRAAAAEKLSGELLEQGWLDVGTPERLQLANEQSGKP
jgi:MurNAc alpha-1-phosphate uridylyltransferase